MVANYDICSNKNKEANDSVEKRKTLKMLNLDKHAQLLITITIACFNNNRINCSVVSVKCCMIYL